MYTYIHIHTHIHPYIDIYSVSVRVYIYTMCVHIYLCRIYTDIQPIFFFYTQNRVEKGVLVLIVTFFIFSSYL